MSLESYLNCYGNLNEETIKAFIERKKNELKKNEFEQHIDGCNINYLE